MAAGQPAAFFNGEGSMADADPDFVFQTSTPMNDVDHHAWVGGCVTEAQSRGGTWFRVTEHPDRPNLILVEVWKAEPAHKPEPRWQAKDS
jgi:hypothetical protein